MSESISATYRIVVGVDGSEGSKSALRWAMDQARMTGGKLEAVASWQDPATVSYSAGWAAPYEGESLGTAVQKVLDETVAEVSDTMKRPVHAMTWVIEGHPAQVLTETARGAQLLVVGTRGHGTFAGLLLGSVSQHCVQHAPCPVVVRAAHRTGRGRLPEDAVKALVIYESMFGDTRTVAGAVADGLSDSAEVDLREVSEAPRQIGDDVDLLVVGGPTYAFGMSRSSTRAEAGKQVEGRLVSNGYGIREWLSGLPHGQGVAVATFDTRMRTSFVSGSAAKGARRQLRRLDFDVSPGVAGFLVAGKQGPLLEGEEERARLWGRELGLAAVHGAGSAVGWNGDGDHDGDR